MINLQWEHLPCPPFLATAAFRGRMRSRRHRWGNRPGQAEQAVGGPELPGARAAIRFFLFNLWELGSHYETLDGLELGMIDQVGLEQRSL